MLLDKQTYKKLKQASYAQMLGFITSIYKQGFEDGANADVDDTVKYVPIKDGTDYICEVCGAKLDLGGLNERENEG